MAKLGHVHIKVRNLERAEKFYTGLLGFKVTEKVSDPKNIDYNSWLNQKKDTYAVTMY